MLSFILFFFFYLLIILATLQVSKILNLYDIPHARKLHKLKVVNTGGISLYIFLFFITLKYEYSYHLELIISYGFLALLFGSLDDKREINAGLKLLLIMIPCGLLLQKGYYISDLGNYDYVGLITLGKYSLIFNILAICLLINSCNYIDGLDGLLTSFFITSLIYILFLIDNSNIKDLLFIIIIPLSINLFFNFMTPNSNLKIFLGNGGSLFVGFFLSFLIIYLYKFEKIHPSYLIWICWYPIYDFLFVTKKRLINKKKFYLADKNHFHHFILKESRNSHFLAVTKITIINILVIIIGYQTAQIFGKLYSLVLFILLYFFFWFIRENQKSFKFK
jgi:UDP-N-acetylmuramyl pentapeptide phosphotransferase/UDP-N-acetylglucosamine-1-phosphate transferase